MGIRIELATLLLMSVLGSGIFAVFGIETPALRKVIKWLTLTGATLLLYWAVGHWSLVLPTGAALAGSIFHFTWRRKNGIDPLTATPRRRYYELRGWNWPE